MTENNKNIRYVVQPTKVSLLSLGGVLLISNSIMVFLFTSGNAIGIASLIGGLIIADFFVLFLLLKEFKTFVLEDKQLTIKYSFLKFLKEIKLTFSDIDYFEVIKYSFQNRASPVFKVIYKNGKRRRVIFRGDDIKPEFQTLFKMIRENGITIKTQGDYWV